MRVKICGLMRPEDVTAALEGGADAVGFVVESPASPRNLELNRARELMGQVPVFMTKVAVTSASDAKSVLKICSRLRPDAIQLHQYRQQLVRLIRTKHPEIKVILGATVADHSSLASAGWIAKNSNAVLADTPSGDGMGGTGRTHDWDLTASLRDRIYPHPLILAGGLTPSNVQAAIRKVRPFAVDVSTGVEERIGVKDHGRIREFIHNSKEETN